MSKIKRRQAIVVVGQTASGKSDLAVKLAKDLNGEVISADSRQVYKDFDLISGKITKDEMQGVKHYLLDVCSVKDRIYSAFDFYKDAGEALKEIASKGKIPIIAGGTGFYIDVLFSMVALESVSVNFHLREKLEQKSAKELFGILKGLSSEEASQIDKNNKRRLVRAIERLRANKDGSSVLNSEFKDWDLIWLGIVWDKDALRERIRARLKERYKQGMCSEIKALLDSGVSGTLLDSLGLEVRYCLRFLTGGLSESEFLIELENKIWQYAKRQATYWKKNKDIKWFHPDDYESILSYTKSRIGSQK